MAGTTPVKDRAITIYRDFEVYITTKTDDKGQYKFTETYSSAGQRFYTVKFAGDTTYALSQGACREYVTIPTQLTFTATKYGTNVNEPILMSAVLQRWDPVQKTWVAFPGQGLTIWHNTKWLPSLAVGGPYIDSLDSASEAYQARTNGDGLCSFFITLPNAAVRDYHAEYYGSSDYSAKKAETPMPITTKYATTLTINVDHSGGIVQHTVSGYLKDQYGTPIDIDNNAASLNAIGRIYIYDKSLVGVTWMWSTYLDYVTTDANGHYSWSHTMASGTWYRTKFVPSANSAYWGITSRTTDYIG